jgi:hypothetical protein
MQGMGNGQGIQIVAAMSEEKKTLRRPKHRWENSKEMDEILISVPLDGFQCLDCVSMEMNSRFVQTAGNFFVSWTIANFS